MAQGGREDSPERVPADETSAPDLSEDLRAALEPEFEIVRELGGGPLSTVYLAREPSLQRLVAVKAMHRAAARRPKALSRFRREACSLARVSHPSVISIFRIGDLESDVPYLVMQYVRGRDLAERLRDDGPLPVSEACRLLSSIASALAAVHSHGIVHRDVRPASILCEEPGDKALLADFGLAAFLADTDEDQSERLTTSGHVITDLRFSSPELLRGTEVTGASDTYALGILAYHALSGSGPFRGTKAQGQARAHLAQQPLPLGALGVEAPSPLEDLVRRCLEKLPEDRPVLEEVTRVLDGLASEETREALVQQSAERVPKTVAVDARVIAEGATKYRMRMLGCLDLQSAEGVVAGILRQPKRVALLAFLAAGQTAGYLRRETLTGVFWPDSDPESGRHSLRQALYVLRQELGPDVLLTRGDGEVGLDREAFFCDAAAFEALANAGKAAEALQLYGGELLPGFFLDDAPEFERWLDVERVRLRRKAAELAWLVSDESHSSGKKAEAGRWARVAVDLDPFDEAALHRLIELLDTLGDRAGALAAYDHFSKRLLEEYAAEPSPETQRLIGRVRKG